MFIMIINLKKKKGSINMGYVTCYMRVPIPN